MSTGLKWVGAGERRLLVGSRSICEVSTICSDTSPPADLDPERPAARLAGVAHHCRRRAAAGRGRDQQDGAAPPGCAASKCRGGRRESSCSTKRAAASSNSSSGRPRVEAVEQAAGALPIGHQGAAEQLFPAGQLRLQAVRHDVVDVLEQHDVGAVVGQRCRLSSSAPCPPGRNSSEPSASRKGRSLSIDRQGVASSGAGARSRPRSGSPGAGKRRAAVGEQRPEALLVPWRDGEMQRGRRRRGPARSSPPPPGAPRTACARRPGSGGRGSVPSGARRSRGRAEVSRQVETVRCSAGGSEVPRRTARPRPPRRARRRKRSAAARQEGPRLGGRRDSGGCARLAAVAELGGVAARLGSSCSRSSRSGLNIRDAAPEAGTQLDRPAGSGRAVEARRQLGLVAAEDGADAVAERAGRAAPGCREAGRGTARRGAAPPRRDAEALHLAEISLAEEVRFGHRAERFRGLSPSARRRRRDSPSGRGRRRAAAAARRGAARRGRGR